jgi:hypothetical protein
MKAGAYGRYRLWSALSRLKKSATITPPQVRLPHRHFDRRPPNAFKR